MAAKQFDSVDDLQIDQLVKAAKDIKESISKKEQEIVDKEAELASLRMNSVQIADALRKFASSLDGQPGPAAGKGKKAKGTRTYTKWDDADIKKVEPNLDAFLKGTEGLKVGIARYNEKHTDKPLREAMVKNWMKSKKIVLKNYVAGRQGRKK